MMKDEDDMVDIHVGPLLAAVIKIKITLNVLGLNGHEYLLSEEHVNMIKRYARYEN